MQNEITFWYTKLMVTCCIWVVFASCLSFCPEDCKYLLGYILCLIIHYPVFQNFHLILHSEELFLAASLCFFPIF